MTRLFCLLALCAGCATAPVATGLSQTMPPELEARGAPLVRYTDCTPSFGPEMTCRRLGTEFYRSFRCVDSGACTTIRDESAGDIYQRTTLSHDAQRDQQHQREFDHANLARYLPWGLVTLAGCVGLVWLISCVQDWWQRRRR